VNKKDSSVNTNTGPFNLPEREDKAFFSFQYNLSQVVPKGFKLGCAITLKQATGTCAVYIHEHVAKPSRENFRVLIDGRRGVKGKDMQVKYVPSDQPDVKSQKEQQQPGSIVISKEMEMVSYKYNKLYLFGAIDSNGKLLN